MNYEDIPLTEDAQNAIKLAFDYLEKGISFLFGGPWGDLEFSYLLVPTDSKNFPERPALDVSKANNAFTLCEEYCTAILLSSGDDFTINAKW
jgi:hypothetical protein